MGFPIVPADKATAPPRDMYSSFSLANVNPSLPPPHLLDSLSNPHPPLFVFVLVFKGATNENNTSA